MFKNSCAKRYLFWSNLSSVTVIFSWYFIKVSRKWSEEVPIFSKLQVYENIHEGFSFSITLKADFCNNVLLQIFSRVQSCFTEIRAFPMDTSLSIRHRFHIEIPRGKFVEISSILKGESTWKLWHRFNLKISTWVRLSKSTKYRWVLHVDFSMLLRPRIDVTALLAVSVLSFSKIFCSGNLF